MVMRVPGVAGAAPCPAWPCPRAGSLPPAAATSSAAAATGSRRVFMSSRAPRSLRARGGEADGLDHGPHGWKLLLVPRDHEAPISPHGDVRLPRLDRARQRVDRAQRASSIGRVAQQDLSLI